MFKRIAKDIRSRIISVLLLNKNWEKDLDDNECIKVHPDEMSFIIFILIIIGTTIGMFISFLMLLFLKTGGGYDFLKQLLS